MLRTYGYSNQLNTYYNTTWNTQIYVKECTTRIPSIMGQMDQPFWLWCWRVRSQNPKPSQQIKSWLSKQVISFYWLSYQGYVCVQSIYDSFKPETKNKLHTSARWFQSQIHNLLWILVWTSSHWRHPHIRTSHTVINNIIMVVIQTCEAGMSLVSFSAQSTIWNGDMLFRSIQHFTLKIFRNYLRTVASWTRFKLGKLQT